MMMVTIRALNIFMLTNGIIAAATERKEQRIVGGDPAPAGRFPFYAHYASEACGATLIHDDILVSAAHCCGYTNCGVRMNSIDIGTGTYVGIDEYIIHPDYDVVTYSNDIMIMKLSEVPAGITPIGYNTNGAIPTDGQALTTIGYGATSEGGSVSDVLLQVTVDTVPHSECTNFYGDQVIESTMICAADEGKDSCQGDSGGPIFSAADGTGEVVGIVSWGRGCARESPGVYTRVSNYEAWINDAICCMSNSRPGGCTCPASFATIQCQAGSLEGCASLSDSLTESTISCLSPDATALVETKGNISVKDIDIGDKVMTASGEYKPVFTISHANPDKPTTFLRVQTNMSDENPLELTPLHMLFLQGKQNPVPAQEVQIGDFLQSLHGPQEVTSITVVTRNGFYNPVTTDGTILVDGIIASTYTSMNGGSHLEIAGTKLLSFQSIFDITISPYRAFCTGVSLDLCNNFGGKKNGKPVVVHFMTQLYEFWLQQNSTHQFFLFFIYMLFFGSARIMFSPVGIFIFVGSLVICRRSSFARFAMKRNRVYKQKST